VAAPPTRGGRGGSKNRSWYYHSLRPGSYHYGSRRRRGVAEGQASCLLARRGGSIPDSTLHDSAADSVDPSASAITCVWTAVCTQSARDSSATHISDTRPSDRRHIGTLHTASVRLSLTWQSLASASRPPVRRTVARLRAKDGIHIRRARVAPSRTSQSPIGRCQAAPPPRHRRTPCGPHRLCGSEPTAGTLAEACAWQR
jgi:hypothetical protein